MSSYSWRQLPSLIDNYIYLVENTDTGQCIVVDPGEAAPVLDFFKKDSSKKPVAIFLTHHHGDHTDGVKGILDVFDVPVKGNEADLDRIPSLSKTINPGESFDCLGLSWETIACDGHTLNQMAFYCQGQNWLFSGDTVFSLGCGRLFEGSPAQMLESLESIAKLPDETLIFIPHEYTLHNLNFSLSILKDDSELLSLKRELESSSGPTVPTSLRFERKNNLFFRTQDPVLKQALNLPDASALEIFTELRKRRDNF
ncbi:hydroxyacylglutathione hydrolase [bacterium]|nr:hydroxyacylglutathione hydrolase [bacterium]